jgi:hypothetical protein
VEAIAVGLYTVQTSHNNISNIAIISLRKIRILSTVISTYNNN